MSNSMNTSSATNVPQVSSPLGNFSSNQIVLTASSLQKNLFQATQKPIQQLQPVASNQIGPNATGQTSPSINLVTTSVATIIPQNQALTSIASPNSTNINSSSSYGGFAHCNNCGEYGVKAAFYGKSKLYCSVACQNGIKKQQQQTQGVKRTIESLNYSSSSSATNSPLPSSSTIVQPTNQQATANLLTQSNKLKTQSNSISETQPQANQVFVQLGTNSGFIQSASETALVLDTITVAQHQPTAEPIQLQPCTDAEQIQNNQIYLIKPSAEADTLEVVVPDQQQINSVTKITEIKAINVEPSSKRPRNNSTSSSDSTKTPISVSNQFTTATQSITEDTQSTILSTTDASSTFEWCKYIEKYNSEAAPVNFFKHAPLSQIWTKFTNKLMVEVPVKNLPEEFLQELLKSGTQECFWFAKVIQFAGYLIKLRYFGASSSDSNNDFWMHICDERLHPVGWTSENDFNLVPPEFIVEYCEDWRDFCLKELVGYKTIPNNFKKKINDALTSKFKKNMLLEVVNKHKLSTMRIARVIESKGGRLRLKYENSDDLDDFYCSELSELIHPIGWSSFVGHEITAPEEYKKKSAIKFEKRNYETNECNPDMFLEMEKIERKMKQFKVGMKLEAIDPLNLSTICVATVASILRNDYIMVKIDGCTEEDVFCYHRNSSSILPAGFCLKNSIHLKEPLGYKGKFKWQSYLNATNSEFAPYELFNNRKVENPFRVGMKIESVDLMTPMMICVATVIAVVGRLIRVHFDGWEPEYDQWIDCESYNIYPVGWCQMNDYKLSEPGSLISEPNKVKKSRKKRVKS